MLGHVVIERRRDGIAILDRATGGRRYAVSGFQAGECLSFLLANAQPSRASIRDACPNLVRRASRPAGA
jgi:hypothetical protein